jgi:hypothetical protein
VGHNPAYPTVAFYGHYDVQVGRCGWVHMANIRLVFWVVGAERAVWTRWCRA